MILYDDNRDFEDFSDIPVDNGTTHIEIETPEDWKCGREGCKTDYKHTHGTYPCFQSPCK